MEYHALGDLKNKYLFSHSLEARVPSPSPAGLVYSGRPLNACSCDLFSLHMWGREKGSSSVSSYKDANPI